MKVLIPCPCMVALSGNTQTEERFLKKKERESVREKPGGEGRLVGKLKGGWEEKRCEQGGKGERGGEEEWI